MARFVPQQGEEVLYDNLGEKWFGNFIPNNILGGPSGEPIIDVDDAWSAYATTTQEKNRFHYVTRGYWGHNDIDYVQDNDNSTQAGVRNDCNGLDYNRVLIEADGFEADENYTCVTAGSDRYTVAGTTYGAFHLQDHQLGTEVRYGAEVSQAPVIRIGRSFDFASPGLSDVTFYGFRTDGIVNVLVLRLSTGAVISFNQFSLNDVAQVDGDLISQQVVDVAPDKSGAKYMVKTVNHLYFVEITGTTPAPPKPITSTQAVAGWDAAGNTTMLAMEWVTNEYCLIISYLQNRCTWYKKPNPMQSQPGVATDKIVKYEGYHSFPHMVINRDGSEAIIIGINNALTGEYIQRIYTAALTPDNDITLDAIYSVNLKPYYGGGAWQSYFFPWSGGDVTQPQLYEKGQFFRGRRRYGTDEFWLVTSARNFILTVGDRLSSHAFEAAAETSVTNKLNWTPITDDDPDFDNIAYLLVERSECDADYSCVYATDDPAVCEYIDDENPSILPVEVDNTGGDFWREVGLVTQADINDFDPLQDTWPDGRPFWYKFRKVSFLNIESESNVAAATTKKPIQPVEINDEKGLDLEYTNIPITARSFGLEWDWTSHGETPAEDFKMWQVAFFEDQNPTVRDDAGWTIHKFWPQPLPKPTIGQPWTFQMPWQYGSSANPLYCFADGVNFKTTKTRTVDKKFLRWTNSAPTEEDDKRYSPLLPDTMYVVTVIGWDNGNLWRASAKETYVPPYRADRDELVIDRQVVYIRTLAETTFAAICNFTKQDAGEIFREWTEDLEPPVEGSASIGGTVASPRALGERFWVDYEIEISRLQFFVTNITGLIGNVRVSLYDFDAGVLGNEPGTEIAASVATINAADVKLGWNTVDFSTPVKIRNGQYLLRVGPQTDFPVAASIDIKTLSWPGDTNRGIWTFSGGSWNQNRTLDMKARVWFNAAQLSDGFVMDGGRQLTFDFSRSSVTDSEETIFEDQCYKDTDLWDIIMGAASDYQYEAGWLKTVPPNNDLILMAKPNENYGIETRSLLLKLTVQYTQVGAPAALPFGILLHETAPEDITIDGNEHPDNGRGYYVINDLITGELFIRQAKRFQGPSEDWYTNFGSPSYPAIKPTGGNKPWDIWVKIVDDTIAVFTELNGYSAEENFNIGNSAAKATIWEANDFWYNFSRYGYFGLYFRDLATLQLEVNDIQLFGAVDISSYEGGQGAQMEYGDGSTSGYRASTEITKIYLVEPADVMESYFAEVGGRNRNNAEDLGFVTPWLDYPALISIDDYKRQTFDFDIKNAPPDAELNVPGIGYTGVTVTMDAVGSDDPEGGTTTFNWDFGDGTTLVTTVPFASHIYNSIGSYLVTMYVEDELGQTSETLTSTIQIGAQYADFVDLEFNHPIQSEDVNRAGGVGSDNIPDRCGGELQDGGASNRRFNINGLHAPPRCCCDEVTNYELVLDLERVCTELALYEEGTTIIPGEEGYDFRTCTDEVYRTLAPAIGSRPVGDLDGLNSMYQQEAQYTFAQTKDVCAVEFWVNSTNLSGFPWSVEVSIQADDGGGNPNGIKLTSAQIPASNLVPGWNRWDFPIAVTCAAGPLWHFVIEPVPCPIGSGLTDFVEFGTIGLAPHSSQQSGPTPTCIPPLWVFNFEEEILMAIWAEEGTVIPPIPGEIIEWRTFLGLIRTGCCDEEFIPFNGGIAQSFDASRFNHDYTTKIKIEVPMCITEDFDGNIEGKLLEDLITGKAVRKATAQLVRNSELPVCEEGQQTLNYNTGTESKFIQEDSDFTEFTPGDARLYDENPGCCDFGDGSDGDVVIAVNTVLAADKQYSSLTVNPGITLDIAGYIVRCNGRVDNFGIITDSQTGGAGGTGGAAGISDKMNEADGNPGSNGGFGSNGSIGGCSGAGGQGGGGGGSGGTQDWNPPGGMLAPGGDGGVGGVGGQGGGCVRLYIWELNNQGQIHSDGFDGLAGSDGTFGIRDTFGAPANRDIAGGGGGGGGGGNGGSPGRLTLYYHTIVTSGSITSNGGIGGTPGDGGDGQDLLFFSPAGGSRPGGAGGGGGPGSGGDGGAGEEDDTESEDGEAGTTGYEPEFLHPTIDFLPGVYSTAQGYYIMTRDNQFNTSTWETITGMTITQNEPANTQLRYLVSFDGRVTWNRWTGSGWAVTPLANIDTLGNTKEELEALTKAQWQQIFAAGTFDIVVDLKTTDEDVTPTISSIVIDYDLANADIAVATFEFDVCKRILDEIGTVYFTMFGSDASAGGFNVISTTPYADRYRYGAKWIFNDNTWAVSAYEDVCLKIYALSDCTELGWCEYEYIDWLRCERALVTLNLPGIGEVGGKIIDHSIGKSFNEPFTWIPFNLVFEEIDLEQFSR